MAPQMLAEIKRRLARSHTHASHSRCKAQQYKVLKNDQKVYSHPDTKKGKVVGVKKGGEMVTAAERRGPWIKFKAVKDSVRVLTTKQEQSKQSVLEEGKGNSFFWIQVEEVDGDGKTRQLLAKDARNSLLREASKRASLRKREGKLRKLLGENETERVSVQLHSILYSTTTTEGLCRRDFLKNFRTYGEDRNWPEALPQKIKTFSDNMTDLIIRVHGDMLRKLQDRSTRDDDAKRLRLLVSLKVEESVYFALRKQTRAAIESDPRHDLAVVERDLAQRIKHYSKQPQSTFGIPKQVESSSGWQSAINELKLIDKTILPSLKLQQLLTCVKEIMAIVANECGNGDMGADDFLPVFTYIIAHGELQEPWFTCRLMWDTTPREVLTGERAYYLTCFESALHTLLEMDRKREPRIKPPVGSPKPAT